MTETPSLEDLARELRAGAGVTGKTDIAVALGELNLSQASPGRIGDDCAVLPDGDGYQLLAMEGFINEFVAADPWFAGWCGVMVNLSDVLAMGGRPTAVVNAVWAEDGSAAKEVLAGMRAASKAYGIAIVGGHTNFSSAQSQLAVSILGKAKALLTSDAARVGDVLMSAVDMRGAYRPPFDNWQAALDAPHERLRGDCELMASLAESGLCCAAKDISQGGVAGTALMLAEASDVGIDLHIDQIPLPENVPLQRWLKSFPSFGFLLSVAPDKVDAVTRHFAKRDITAAEIGQVVAGGSVSLCSDSDRTELWNHRNTRYLGLRQEEPLYAHA